jgi:membrane protease YdiL (CAAX protease family)
VLSFARKRGASVGKEIGLTLDQPFKNFGAGLIGWGISLPLIYAASSLAMLLFPNLPDPSNPAIPLTLQSSGLLARISLYITICVLAPIFEEIMFRGLFYQSMRAMLGVWPAIIVTGVVFGLVHPVSIVGSMPLMLLGGVFAWLAETRKSLVPGMVAHSLQNTMSFLMMLFLN